MRRRWGGWLGNRFRGGGGGLRVELWVLAVGASRGC